LFVSDWRENDFHTYELSEKDARDVVLKDADIFAFQFRNADFVGRQQ